jgi:hypothetical protein
MLKKIFLGLLLLLVAIQFVRPAKNQSSAPDPDDVTALHPTPPAVKQLLSVACFDCHSNHTRYPWYAEVQPLGWWLAQHVRDGKRELNFSELGAYKIKTAAGKLDACIDEITDKKMPLPSYRLTHGDARLTDAQIKLLTEWFEETRDAIKEGASTPAASDAAKP